MRRKRCSVGSRDPGGLLRGLDHRVGRLLRARHRIQLPGVRDTLVGERRGSIQASRWAIVRTSRAEGVGRRISISRSAGWPRAERRALLRQDPPQARRPHAGRSLLVPGVWNEMGAADGATPRSPGPGLRQGRSRGAAYGAGRTDPAVPGSHFGVLAATRLRGFAALRPVRYANGQPEHDDSRMHAVTSYGWRATRRRRQAIRRGARVQGWE